MFVGKVSKTVQTIEVLLSFSKMRVKTIKVSNVLRKFLLTKLILTFEETCNNTTTFFEFFI